VSTRLARIGIALLAIIALTASTLAVVQFVRLHEAEENNERLQRDLAEAKARIDELDDDASDKASGNSAGDQGGLQDLFGGQDAFRDLFGARGSADLVQCVTASGRGPEDALGGLLSGISDPTARDRPGRAEVTAITSAVEKIRKLRLDERVDATFLRPDKLARRATRLFLRDYPREDADDEERLLVALGAIPRATDLRRLTKKLLETQIAGFYVPKTNRLFVPGAPDEPLTATEKSIVAHELEHALVDHTLDLPLPGRPDPSQIDSNLATLAVVEGDATLTMQRYTFAYIPVFEQLSIVSDPTYVRAQAALADIPHYLVQQLSFPYIDGLEFTCYLYAKGGWNAVNRAYENPPHTSAQVLFPDRYRRGFRAENLDDPSTPSGRWTHEFGGTFGAANLMWLFEAPGGDTSQALSDPRARASAWGGGEVHVWARDRESAVALRIIERAGADGLCGSIREWYEATFDNDDLVRTGDRWTFDGPVQDAVIRCREHEVHVGIGPNVATARSLIG
jgi:hypothetical protein